MEQPDDTLSFRALPLPYCTERINQTSQIMRAVIASTWDTDIKQLLDSR